MPLDDLCRCSRTCKRLQVLCGNHFLQKYSEKRTEEVRIRIEHDGNLCVDPVKQYVQCFDNFIKNLNICVWANKKSIQSHIENFVQTKCDQSLQRICISGDLQLVPLCKKLEISLRSVEAVEFVDRIKSGKDETIFLKYCPNITKLNLSHRIHEKNVEAILKKKFHLLTHFYCMLGKTKNLKPKQWKKFFQVNDKIQCVAWGFNIYDNKNGDEDRTVECIKTLNYALRLDHLLLSIGPPLTKRFDVIFEYLNVLCARDNFKSLELKLKREPGASALQLHANQLANWKQLTKIHLGFIRLSDVIPTLRSLIHVRIIVFEYLWHEDNWERLLHFDGLDNSAQNMALPQVEEVHIDYINNYETLSNCVTLFACHWMNLKRLVVPVSSKCRDVKFDVAALNSTREKLENACELTIFTNQEGNATNLDHKFVKLKFVEFKYDCVCPFQRYYIT